MAASDSNKFGKLADLGNEATVEQFFVSRLLTDLGYKDSQIKPKASLQELSISKGRKSEKWRPDYAIEAAGAIRWICEAKGVEENLDKWVGQSSSYCLALNSTQASNPVEFFMLTNGVTTRLYRWDNSEPLVEAAFHDFEDANQSYAQIRELLSPGAFAKPAKVAPVGAAEAGRHILRRHTVADLNSDFAWVHRLIYRRENMSTAAAFMEFVKVIFLKLSSDRKVHESADIRNVDERSISVPAEEVRFSRTWLKSRQQDTANPLDSIAFQDLLTEFEQLIIKKKKKRIFPKGERLNLSPETLEQIVERLEAVDLISIDADLNGRMFETFLNSTLRGKDLGQYFTPRSVVKLATGLATLRADATHIDRVIDACCGTGGFLIEALADMWSKLDANTSLTNKKREELRSRVAEESLIGVDVARDPALARIARINMYLHGDGGTRVYQLDALDKAVTSPAGEDPELHEEKDEFRTMLSSAGATGLVDVVLTNPPFAKEYERKGPKDRDTVLLDAYELSYKTVGGAREPLKTLGSLVMFLERYFDLLAPGGRLISVVDDSILGSKTHDRVRKWIRENWIVKAVVSLPGDAFQRSQARVKTSILILEKKSSPEEVQSDVFMYYCTAVGIDDAPRARVLPIDEENRRLAVEEVARVTELFEKFKAGDATADEWRVPPDAIADRMDVKACLPRQGVRIAEWEAAGFTIQTVEDLARLAITPENRDDRVIDTSVVDEAVTYLRVRYDGFAEAGDDVSTADLPKRELTRVEEGDIVFSHINTIHGAVAVVPAELAGLYVTNEYTVCRSKGELPTSVLWALLRAPEARSELLLLSTGIGRTRVNWDLIKRLRVPIPGAALRKQIQDAIEAAEAAEAKAKALRVEARVAVESGMLMSGERADTIIAAFKPPR